MSTLNRKSRRRARGSKHKSSELTRRAFLEKASTLGVTLVAAPFVLDLTGCGSDSKDVSEPITDASSPHDAANEHDAAHESDANEVDSSTVDASDSDGASPIGDAIAAGAVLLGLYEGDGEAAARAAVSKLDFSWLSAGDTVLIKVASNSGHVHPAVTSPTGVKGIVAHLKELGAGRVIVADQAGVEWVRRSAAGRFSSTRERFTENGLLELEAHSELHFFDDNGFEDGYFEATLPEGHHWPRGMFLPNVLKEVDHIIYMPRLSQHILAGVTLAQKSAIGFIRDDSRHDLHNDALDFYEKYTEINYTEELRSRTRLVINVSEKIQLHGGPDVGTVYAMSPTLVLASSSLANHDAVGASLLMTLGAMVTPEAGGMTYNSGFASLFNTAFAGGTGVGTGDAGPWISESESSAYIAHPFADGITKDRAVQRGWSLSGGQPDSIAIVQDGATLEDSVKTGVETHGEGLYAFS
jgi:uncharacterized protein (DUF362 family)